MGMLGRKRRRRTPQCARGAGRKNQSLSARAVPIGGTAAGNARLRIGMSMLMIVPDNSNRTSWIFLQSINIYVIKNVDVKFLVHPIYSSWIVVDKKLVFRNL